MKVRLTLKSRNVKTGNIPVSTTERGSCPKTCIFKKNGCYADGGPLALVWDQVPDVGTAWMKFCDKIKDLKPGQLWRHNQAGDLPHNGQTINGVKMLRLIAANQGKNGFTYTHHDMSKKENKRIVKIANKNGFTINLSGNNLDHADKLKALNIAPVVVVLPIDQVKNLETPAGDKVTVCPAAIDATNTINCKSCKLCAIANRETIIGFPAHGVSKNKVNQLVEDGTKSI